MDYFLSANNNVMMVISMVGMAVVNIVKYKKITYVKIIQEHYQTASLSEKI
jgi:hypothetical protein